MAVENRANDKKEYSAEEVVCELKKALLDKVETGASPELKAVLSDLNDKNAVAEVPKTDVPTDKINVLNKKDGNQDQQKPIAAPKLSNNVPPNVNEMKIQEQKGASPSGMLNPKEASKATIPGMKPISEQKNTSKLQSFLGKIETKRNSLKKEMAQAQPAENTNVSGPPPIPSISIPGGDVS